MRHKPQPARLRGLGCTVRQWLAVRRWVVARAAASRVYIRSVRHRSHHRDSSHRHRYRGPRLRLRRRRNHHRSLEVAIQREKEWDLIKPKEEEYDEEEE